MQRFHLLPRSRYGRRRALAVILIAILSWQLLATTRSAASRQQAWDAGPAVWVTTRAVDAGATISAEDVTKVDAPKVLTPSDIVANPIGRATRAAIPSNVIVATHLLASTDPTSDAAALDLARVAVRVPLATTPPAIVAGDRVALWASVAIPSNQSLGISNPDLDVDEPNALSLGAPIINDAIVIQRTDEDLTVSIGQGDIALLVGAMPTSSLIAVALSPKGHVIP